MFTFGELSMANKNPNKTIHRITSLLCVFALTAGTLACGKEKQEEIVLVEDKKEAHYSLTEAEQTDVVLSDKLTLRYVQKEQADQFFKLNGYLVKKIYVEKGDTVKKGDLLAELERPDLDDLLVEIETNIHDFETKLRFLNERQDLENDQAKRMKESGELKDDAAYEAYLQKIKEKYESDIKECENNIYYQTLRLDYYNESLEEGKLYANMDGIVSYVRTYSPNQTSSEFQKTVTIIDSAKCTFSCDDIRHSGLFSENTVYEITAIDGTVYETHCHLSEDGTALNFDLIEPDFSIPIGTKAYFNVELERAENVVAVKNQAVHHAGDLYYVYYIDENNIRNVEYVDVGLIGDSLCEIKSGVKAGDILVLK